MGVRWQTVASLSPPPPPLRSSLTFYAHRFWEPLTIRSFVMLVLRTTPLLAALSLLSVLSAASSDLPSQLPPHAALPPSHSSSLFADSSSSSAAEDSLKALPQPLPFKIKRPRSLEQVQQNLGKRLAKRGEEGSKTERVPFVSRTAAATGGGDGQGRAETGRATQRVTAGGSRGGGSVAAAQPVPSTTQTVETGSKIVSTGLLTMASPSAAAGGSGGTVTQVETASSGVLITSTAGPASSASASDVASAQAAEATSSTSMTSGGAAAGASVSRMLAGGVAGFAAVLLVR
ncbi:hypothetical protein OF846_004140 [Rhodotorula toruloides]|nr:hypothetical protein OF846_004140 [Rhodotorula toruloides]